MSFRRLLHNIFVLYDTSFFTLENPKKDVGIEIGIDIFGSAVGKKRSTTKCLLNYENNQPKKLCRAFFLKTLGMSPANDSIIRNSLKYKNPEKESNRGRHNRFPFPQN
jgi:hypothetical protein